jgi:anhydro-N-acetylmuramic acid kinase
MKEIRLVVGLMSGTSLDGIDAALVEVAGAGLATRAKLEYFLSVPFEREVSARLLRVASGKPQPAAEISQLNFLLGTLYSEAVLRLCREARIELHQLDLIGSHGQTIYHQSEPSPICGRPMASTLQIGEASIIAERTGVTTVSDFRPRDMAAGGKGAPLIPYVDYLLFRDSRRGRILLNIGGIANLTTLPASARINQVKAFDTGPGNMVIDGLVRHFTLGENRYDAGGSIAASGKVIPDLLKSLLCDPYFVQRPPKTSGREQFGEAFVSRFLDYSRSARFEDLVCTATELTARTVVDSILKYCKSQSHYEELIVSGGGAHNTYLFERLANLLPQAKVLKTDDLGIPVSAKEAVGFAILANETLHLRAGNVPSATGAVRPVILGKVVVGRNLQWFRS